MTLHIFDDLEQGTGAWLEARRGIVTASVVGQLLTPTLKVAHNDTSRALTATLVAERISGFTEDTYRSADMWRGVEHEPIARGYYAEHYAPVTECGFMRLDLDGCSLGYSPDGLVGDDGCIEIKCPRPRQHIRTILADDVPASYVAQCQAALLVSGREWIDFVSFSSGLPLWVKRVEPDLRWFEAIEEAVAAFEQTAAQMVAAYKTATAGLPATERVVELEMSL